MCKAQDRSRDRVPNRENGAIGSPTAGDAGPLGQQPAGSPLLNTFLREREHLKRIAAGMGMDSADAEDVLQDVSLQVLKHAGQFEQENIMVRWLVRTTVNRCLTEYRRRFRHKASRILRRRPDLGQILGDDNDAAGRAGLGEELEVVRRTLAELDPSLLLIVVLRYFCDLDSKDIAEIMELNASTVRGRLREARMILAGKLIQRGIGPQ